MTQVTPLLNEASYDLIKEYFDANFNLALQQTDNQYSDGISLEPIQSDAIFISDKVQTLKSPCAFFLFGELAFDYSEDPNFLEGNNNMLIVVSVEDVGAERLTRKAWRFGRVLYATFNQIDLQDTAGRMKIRTIPRRLGYSDDKIVGKLNQSDQKFRKDVVLEIEIMHYENNLTDI